jgi:hypothetical protein
LASDKAYPQLRSSYSHAEMLRSSPVRWCLLGRNRHGGALKDEADEE